jgi:hypothetical protein
MRRSTGPRNTASLSNSVDEHLNMYALAAGAAGVGMLAMAQPAAAKIIYTRAHINIGFDQAIPLDLNHDGIADFELGEGYGDSSNGGISALGVYPAGQSPNAIVGYASDGHRRAYASALRPGARVGKGRAFSSRNGSMAVVRYFDYSHRATFKGPWANSGKGVKNRYLGLKFFVKGKIHYGWARLNVVISNGTPLGTLTGYAYETIPGKAIIAGATKGPDDDPQPIAATQPPAPKPATLGMLALGAPGLSIWRREEPATATSKGN